MGILASPTPAHRGFLIGTGKTTVVIEILVSMLRDRAARIDSGEVDDEVDNEVFRKQYIPQTLNDVYDAERDASQVKTEGRNALVYKDLLATSNNGGAPLDNNDDDTADSDESASGDSDAASDSESDMEADYKPRGKRFQDKDRKPHLAGL